MPLNCGATEDFLYILVSIDFKPEHLRRKFSPEYSLEDLMLKLQKLWPKKPTNAKEDLMGWERLKAGKVMDKRMRCWTAPPNRRGYNESEQAPGVMTIEAVPRGLSSDFDRTDYSNNSNVFQIQHRINRIK